MLSKGLVVAVLLAASTKVFAGFGFESVSEFRQCGKEVNSLNELDSKMEREATELSGLNLRAISMNTSIEMQRAWVSDYNSRMRLNASISEYKAFYAEVSRRVNSYNRRVDKYSEHKREFERTCENRTVDLNGDVWKEVCQDTNQYSVWCQAFKSN